MSKIKVNEIEAATGSTVTIPTGQTFTVTDGIPATNLSGTIADARLPTVPVSKGGTGLTSLGSAGQSIKVNSGGNALEFGTISSDYVLIKTQNITSNVSFVDFIHGTSGVTFDTTYDKYKIIFNNIIVDSGTPHIKLYPIVSGGAVRTSGFKSVGYRAYFDGSGNGHDIQTDSGAFLLLNMNTATSYSGGMTNAEITMYDPANSSTKTMVFSNAMGNDGTYTIAQFTGGTYNTVEAHVGFRVKPASNNLANGTISLYGIKK